MCKGLLRPISPRVEIIGNRPKTWSPCRWEMNMAVSLIGFTPTLISLLCTPSPASTR